MVEATNYKLRSYHQGKREADREKHHIRYFLSNYILYLGYQKQKKIFSHSIIPQKTTVQLIKDQVRQRILYLNTKTKKYTMYIDSLLQ